MHPAPCTLNHHGSSGTRARSALHTCAAAPAAALHTCAPARHLSPLLLLLLLLRSTPVLLLCWAPQLLLLLLLLQLVVLAGIVWNPPTSCAWAARVYVNNKWVLGCYRPPSFFDGPLPQLPCLPLFHRACSTPLRLHASAPASPLALRCLFPTRPRLIPVRRTPSPSPLTISSPHPLEETPPCASQLLNPSVPPAVPPHPRYPHNRGASSIPCPPHTLHSLSRPPVPLPPCTPISPPSVGIHVFLRPAAAR